MGKQNIYKEMSIILKLILMKKEKHIKIKSSEKKRERRTI